MLKRPQLDRDVSLIAEVALAARDLLKSFEEAVNGHENMKPYYGLTELTSKIECVRNLRRRFSVYSRLFLAMTVNGL